MLPAPSTADASGGRWRNGQTAGPDLERLADGHHARGAAGHTVETRGDATGQLREGDRAIRADVDDPVVEFDIRIVEPEVGCR